MTPWPSGLFVELAFGALTFYVVSVFEDWLKSKNTPPPPAPAPAPAQDVPADDGFMEDPLWLEIADAAEDFLHRGDTLSRHRLERALEAVEC